MSEDNEIVPVCTAHL